jgi:hypothetical protein
MQKYGKNLHILQKPVFQRLFCIFERLPQRKSLVFLTAQAATTMDRAQPRKQQLDMAILYLLNHSAIANFQMQQE